MLLEHLGTRGRMYTVRRLKAAGTPDNFTERLAEFLGISPADPRGSIPGRMVSWQEDSFLLDGGDGQRRSARWPTTSEAFALPGRQDLRWEAP